MSAPTKVTEPALTELVERVAGTLKSDKSMKAAHADQMMREVSAALSGVQLRIAAIQPSGVKKALGPVRQAVAASGTRKELEALDSEHQMLVYIAGRLESQQATLTSIRDAARRREAFESIPGLIEQLGADVDALQAAQRAMVAAQAKLWDTFGAIGSARGIASTVYSDLPAVDLETFGRMAALDVRYERHSQSFAASLGITLAQERMQWAA